MINIYDANETNFEHNGLATLNPISAEFSVDINGAWSLVVVLPYDREKKYTYLTENNLIIADLNCIREQSTRQMFRIYDIKRNLNTVTIIAFPVGMEATYDAPIEELNISSCSGSSAASTINSYLSDHDQDTYNISSDVTNTSSSQYENTNLIAAISGSDDNSFVNKWGGEVVYDNFNIKILKEVGEDVKFPVRYGRNLTGLEYHVDVSNVITRIYPISSDGMRLHTYPDTSYEDGQTYVENEAPDAPVYPYDRSAFIKVDYELLDTDEKSYSNTAIATRAWTTALYNAIYAKASELWETAKDDLTNIYCPAYIQEILSGKDDDKGIIEYTQARYAYSHKGWQSLIKSLIKQGMEWIKKEKLADWKWIARQGWYYGTNNADGSMKNYPVNQYIYSYSDSKWYHFSERGLMDYDQSQMSQETIDLLNTYDWHTDENGQYYGDGVSGSGNFFTNAWIENSNGTHSWVGEDGYYVADKDDSETWAWTQLDGWMYGESLTRYAKNEYVEIDKNLEYFGDDGYWHDWEKISIDDMGWYQVKDTTSPHFGKWWYGSIGRNYAHNEFVYVKKDGVWKEWWYDEEGWYDDSSSGDSSYDWHGDATSGYWFGEEDASTEDKSKYLHDCWAYIDDGTSEFGTYYWFNSNGYISGDATLAKQDWAWGDITDDVTGKHWFGNRDASFNRVWISNQWLEIDGEWYYFDSDGYAVDKDVKKSEVISWFSNALYTAVTPTITAKLKEAYDLLYSQMEAWCNKQFEQGLDRPNVSITVDLVDLSKTTEYAEYQNLEKIYLGDTVECVDAVHGISSSERVVGLTYDVIRGYNTKVTIGQLGESLSSILSVSYKGSSGGETKLIAGDNIVINGNVISSSDKVGAVIGLQDATYKGQSVVNGNVAILDNVGTKVIANPEGTPTADLTKLRVEDVIYKLAEGGGSIGYGLNEPTGGSDGDAYFQHANAIPFTITKGAFDGVIKLYSKTQQIYWFDMYGTPTGGGADDIYLNFRGLKNNVTYKLIFDFKFDDDTRWMTSYNDWIYVEDAQGTRLDYVELEDNYEFQHFELSFTGSPNNRRLAFYFNNVQDSQFSRAVMTFRLEGELNIDWNEPQEIIDIWQNVNGTWYSYLENPYQAGDRITIDTETKYISADAQILSGDSQPSQDLGEDGYLYCQIGEGGTAEYQTIWSGSVSTSAWANPQKIGNVNPSEYGKIRINGTYEKLVSEITEVGSSEPAWHPAGYMYIYTKENGTELWLYSQTGHNSTVTQVEGIPISSLEIKAIYQKINGRWVKMEGGSGGGSSVIANPSGTPTDTLNTVEIDNVIYDLPTSGGGGGSGSGYEETILLDTQTTVTSGSTLILNDDYTNYDMIVIDASTSEYVEWRDQIFIDVAQMELNVEHTRVLLRTSASLYGLRYKFTGVTSLYAYGDGNRGIIIYNIIGIKFGGSDGASTIYSTEEQQIGTWIDGKPLYQKTFSYTSPTSNIDVLNLNIDSVIELKGTYYDGTNWHPVIRTATSFSYQTHIYCNQNTSIIVGGLPSNTIKEFITIQYTKTTD